MSCSADSNCPRLRKKGTEPKASSGSTTDSTMPTAELRDNPLRAADRSAQNGSEVQARWPRRAFSILEDVLGPLGHGPSSSHTIAPHRAALELRAGLGGTPDAADIWHVNSFATTGEGHGTDIAVTAGLLGLPPTDPATREAPSKAREAGLQIAFHAVPNDPEEHPNTLYVCLRRGKARLCAKLVSIGGGNYALDTGSPVPARILQASGRTTRRAT